MWPASHYNLKVSPLTLWSCWGDAAEPPTKYWKPTCTDPGWSPPWLLLGLGTVAVCKRMQAVPPHCASWSHGCHEVTFNESTRPRSGIWNDGRYAPHLKEHGRWKLQQRYNPVARRSSVPFISCPASSPPPPPSVPSRSRLLLPPRLTFSNMSILALRLSVHISSSIHRVPLLCTDPLVASAAALFVCRAERWEWDELTVQRKHSFVDDSHTLKISFSSVLSRFIFLLPLFHFPPSSNHFIVQ